jgi:hypothetical protein
MTKRPQVVVMRGQGSIRGVNHRLTFMTYLWDQTLQRFSVLALLIRFRPILNESFNQPRRLVHGCPSWEGEFLPSRSSDSQNDSKKAPQERRPPKIRHPK